MNKKTIVVTTHKTHGIHGNITHVFFALVDNGITKRTLSSELAYSDKEVTDIIAEVQDFFLDDYEFEFI